MEILGQSVQGRDLVAHVLGEGRDTTIVFGGFHGDEPCGAYVAKQLLAHLRGRPEAIPTGHRVVVMPAANPDGLEAGTRGNANGVDLNRNFPTDDWSPIATKPRYAPGPAPASEPETRAVMDLLERYPPDKVVSIHSPLHTLNWTGRGERLAAEMARHDGFPTTGDIGYSAPGCFGDYCGLERDIAIVTLELADAPCPAEWEQHREALLAAVRFGLPRE